MNTLELVHNLTLQHNQRYKKLWGDLLQMADMQFNKGFEPANLSIGDHIMLALEELNRWLGFLKGERDTAPIRINQPLFLEPGQIYDLWNQTTLELQRFIDLQSQEDLNNTAEGIQGPVWEVIIHMLMFAEEQHNYIITILAHLNILPQTQRVNRDLWHFQPEKLSRHSTGRLISC